MAVALSEPAQLAASEASALHAEDIEVVLSGVRILQRVDLTLRAGRVTGVLGPSGAGKTTLFRVLVGEVYPTKGVVHLDGRDVTDLPLWLRARRGLGYVPQGPSALLDISVGENIRTFAEILGIEVGSVSERAKTVGLEHRLSVRVRELSGGEQRRISLLRAFMAEPRVLICDEPFAGVDPARAGEIARLLRGHANKGASVLIADHRVREALEACDEAHLLADGLIEASTPAEEFAHHPAVRDRYLG